MLGFGRTAGAATCASSHFVPVRVVEASETAVAATLAIRVGADVRVVVAEGVSHARLREVLPP